jgi:hypothetical protein
MNETGLEEADLPLELTAEERRAKLNLETARIAWHELQRFFAAGRVVEVAPALNLLDVAGALVDDDTAQFQQWLETEQVSTVSDARAVDWFEEGAMLWAVVVNPWVLVQEPDDRGG